MPTMTRRASTSSLLAAASLLAALPVAAVNLTMTFTGTITYVDPALDAAFSLDEPVFGSVLFDSSTPDSFPADPSVGYYVLAPSSAISFHFGSYAASSSPAYMTVENSVATFDRFIATTNSGCCEAAPVGEWVPSNLKLLLAGPAAVFADDSIPTRFSLEDFNQHEASIEFLMGGGGETIQVSAQVDSLVVSSSPTTVDWDDGPTGSAGPVDVAVSNVEGSYLDQADLSGFDFAAAPLPATPSEVLVYEGRSDWTATLSEPATRLLVHAVSWRGSDAGVDPVTYHFDVPFEILSGFAEATVVGNSGGAILELPGSGFHSGILEFCGPISSLTATTNSPTISDQLLTLSLSPLPGAIPVDWSSPTTGSAGGIDVTVSNLETPVVAGLDYTSADFSAGALCSTAESIDYATGSDWMLTLSEAAGSLLLYVKSWRGVAADVDPVTYQFDTPFTIRSGLAQASVSNDSTLLTLPALGFHDGILRFDGPITSLSLDTNSTVPAFQGMTIAVPEQGSAGAAVASLAALLALRRRAGFSGIKVT